MASEVTNGNDAVTVNETNGASVEKSVTFTAMKTQVFVESSKVNDAVSFYKSAFGAEEMNRVCHPKRKADQELPNLQSAEIKLGSSSIILSDDANATVGSGVVFCLETEDIEAAVEKAVKAGATADGEITEGEGAWFGGRVAKVKDSYGVVWVITTPIAAKKSANVEA